MFENIFSTFVILLSLQIKYYFKLTLLKIGACNSLSEPITNQTKQLKNFKNNCEP